MKQVPQNYALMKFTKRENVITKFFAGIRQQNKSIRRQKKKKKKKKKKKTEKRLENIAM